MNRLLITRTLPDDNHAFAKAHFDTTLRDADRGLTEEEAAEALRQYDAILPTLGDRFTAGAFAAAGADLRCRILANFGVGYNHIDVAAAKAAETEKAQALYAEAEKIAADATALREKMAAFEPEFAGSAKIAESAARVLAGNVRPSREERIAARRAATAKA